VFSYFKKIIKVQRFQSTNISLPQFTLAKLRLAAHPQACSEALSRLAKSKIEQVLVRVAENANTPKDVLCDLALSDSAEVRSAVADNQNTPARALFLLAMDKDLDVRYSIAENHNAPLAVLQLLSQDENPYVACRAVSTMKRAFDFPSAAGAEHVWVRQGNLSRSKMAVDLDCRIDGMLESRTRFAIVTVIFGNGYRVFTWEHRMDSRNL